VSFSVTASGAAPLTYQWRLNGNDLADSAGRITGATSNILTIWNVQHTDSGLYSVAVANSLGSALSSDALLTVSGPPNITSQPVSQTVSEGGLAVFTVGVSGTPPFSYQWRLNGSNIEGAAGPSYTIAAAQWSHAGYYTVLVSNACGTITSDPASLSLLDLAMYAGLTIVGPAGATYQVQYATNLENPAWLALTNCTLTASPYRFVDWDSAGAPKRFYRAVPQ
jgi:hypothetical protein